MERKNVTEKIENNSFKRQENKMCKLQKNTNKCCLKQYTSQTK